VRSGDAQCHSGAGARPARVRFISGLDQVAAAHFLAAFRDGLVGLGYVEPRTPTIELFFADYVPERIPALLEER
jgi:hypothetical protein